MQSYYIDTTHLLFLATACVSSGCAESLWVPELTGITDMPLESNILLCASLHGSVLVPTSLLCIKFVQTCCLFGCPHIVHLYESLGGLGLGCGRAVEGGPLLG